jgi:class 3 adenylate cyclase
MAHTATILFTDLVGSTAMTTALTLDRADELRKTHFALLREGVAAFGGDEVKNLGDGLMVAFSSVRDAVGCAVAMQQAIDRYNRRGRDAPLGIRVGISIGDVTSEDRDYYGVAVVEAARLCATAEGGQILCHEVVARLAGGPGGYTFQPIGALQLKGLPEPVPASQVAWEPVHGGLPLPPGLSAESALRFVGRTAERATLEAAWKAAVAGNRRAVLVSGEPGIGKTRLLTEAALAAHAAGGTVLYGRCDEELALPYQPFVEALRHYVAARRGA